MICGEAASATTWAREEPKHKLFWENATAYSLGIERATLKRKED